MLKLEHVVRFAVYNVGAAEARVLGSRCPMFRPFDKDVLADGNVGDNRRIFAGSLLEECVHVFVVSVGDKLLKIRSAVNEIGADFVVVGVSCLFVFVRFGLRVVESGNHEGFRVPKRGKH